jgi:hypothetical protein
MHLSKGCVKVDAFIESLSQLEVWAAEERVHLACSQAVRRQHTAQGFEMGGL